MSKTKTETYVLETKDGQIKAELFGATRSDGEETASGCMADITMPDLYLVGRFADNPTDAWRLLALEMGRYILLLRRIHEGRFRLPG